MRTILIAFHQSERIPARGPGDDLGHVHARAPRLPRLHAPVVGAAGRRQRQPDDAGGHRLADVRPDRLGLGPGSGRAAAVPAGAGAGAGRRPRGRPAPPRAHRRAVRGRAGTGGAGDWPPRPSTGCRNARCCWRCRWCWVRCAPSRCRRSRRWCRCWCRPRCCRAPWPSVPPDCRARSSPARRWAASSTWPGHRWCMACARRCSAWRLASACASVTLIRRPASRSAWTPCSPACATCSRTRWCWARSRSTCSRCCSAAPWRCCRSSPRTSCRSAPGAWGCCAARPRSARW